MENIRVHGVEMEGVPRPISITMNWNPSYSYATLPPGVRMCRPTGRLCSRRFRRNRDCRISATSASQISRQLTLSRLSQSALTRTPRWSISNSEILTSGPKSAGSIQNAENWKFTDTRIQAADGSKVTVKDSRGVEGLN